MLSSMTGFASVSDETDGYSWVFEVKSVNGRGLDLRLNLPPGCEKLEQPIRALFKAAFTRGNMQAGLQLRDLSDATSLKIDTRLLGQLARRTRILDRSTPGNGMSPASDLLALRGVLSGDRSAMDISPDDATGTAILESVSHALSQLDEARKREGEALFSVLSRVIDDMSEETVKARTTADAQPEKMLARLKDRVSAVLEDARVSEERLEQEVAILITKADVTEEIDRLSAHFEEARRLLASGKPSGRKLDFLSQELLREANTLGSKAASLEMTRHSLALKSYIDQFKEQSANVE